MVITLMDSFSVVATSIHRTPPNDKLEIFESFSTNANIQDERINSESKTVSNSFNIIEGGYGVGEKPKDVNTRKREYRIF